jgi:hypothetical protein
LLIVGEMLFKPGKSAVHPVYPANQFLVGGLEHLDYFSIIYGIILPID